MAMGNARVGWRGRRAGLKEPQRNDVDYQEVARVAYELFIQRGQRDGRDLDDWLTAEAMVRSRRATDALTRPSR